MQSTLLLALSLLFAVVAPVDAADCITNANGQVVCGKGQCARDQYGKVFCAGPGGGAVADGSGNVVCGVGACIVDDMGKVQCSTTPGGGVERDSYGKAVCLGGCRAGTPQLCEAP